MKNLSYTLKVASKNIFILFFFISFVCLVVILLILCIILLWDSTAAHSHSGEEFNLSSQEDPIFQGVAPRYKIFTSSCVIPLWDSATAHSLSGKEVNLSSQEDARFSWRYILAYNFHFVLYNPSLGPSTSSLTV